MIGKDRPNTAFIQSGTGITSPPKSDLEGECEKHNEQQH